MENWLHFSDPRFDLAFKYPRWASDGEPVESVESQFEGGIRIHVLSPVSREVYFEVSRYESLSANAEHQRHRTHLQNEFHPLTISGIKSVVCASLPAYEYSFAWDQGERTVILVERGSATYRVLYNPRFSVNLQILSTVRWLSLGSLERAP